MPFHSSFVVLNIDRESFTKSNTLQKINHKLKIDVTNLLYKHEFVNPLLRGTLSMLLLFQTSKTEYTCKNSAFAFVWKKSNYIFIGRSMSYIIISYERCRIFMRMQSYAQNLKWTFGQFFIFFLSNSWHIWNNTAQFYKNAIKCFKKN